MDCRKNWTLLELAEFCKDEDNVLEFLKNRGLIPQSMNCPKCGWGMKILKQEKTWKCYKTIKTKKGRKICGKKISINKNTWFSKTKLSYKQVLMITYMLVQNYEPNTIARELQINKSTVSQWNHFVKQVIVEWLNSNSEPIGGEGKIVEVNESKFGKRKYNRGRVLEGQWVFGGICQETKKIFLVPVEDRTSTTLITIIKQWILSGSTIISHCKRCNMLSKEGYEHLRVNHSVTFIDSDTGAHTNTLEFMCRHTKEFLSSNNRRKNKFLEYLSHYMFFNNAKKKHLDVFEGILEEISRIKFDDDLNLDVGDDNESDEEDESLDSRLSRLEETK